MDRRTLSTLITVVLDVIRTIFKQVNQIERTLLWTFSPRQTTRDDVMTTSSKYCLPLLHGSRMVYPCSRIYPLNPRRPLEIIHYLHFPFTLLRVSLRTNLFFCGNHCFNLTLNFDTIIGIRNVITVNFKQFYRLVISSVPTSIIYLGRSRPLSVLW